VGARTFEIPKRTMGEAETSGMQLRIAEAFLDEVGRGLARLDAGDLGALDAVRGDVLLITGRRATVAREAAWPLTHSGQRAIAVDGTARDNAQVGIDERVAVRKVPFKPAESLLLVPVQAWRSAPTDA
jgi:transitional endoplasmic reticulum ATPase